MEILYNHECRQIQGGVSKYKYKDIVAGTQRGERVSRYGCEGTSLHLACPEGQLLQVHHQWIVSHGNYIS